MAEASTSEPGCLPKEEREKVKEEDIAYDWKNAHGEWVLKVRPYRVMCSFSSKAHVWLLRPLSPAQSLTTPSSEMLGSESVGGPKSPIHLKSNP